VIDVFEEEPLNTESNIWDMLNVIITPHNRFVGDLNQERLWILIQKNLIRQRREMRDE
jgi:phosphoglycerate dehydrogenase-like enzyme